MQQPAMVKDRSPSIAAKKAFSTIDDITYLVFY
jgi:hypothetical protein